MALPVLLPLEQLVLHSLEGRAAQRRASLVLSSRTLFMTHPPWVGGMLREDEVGMPPRVSTRTSRFSQTMLSLWPMDSRTMRLPGPLSSRCLLGHPELVVSTVRMGHLRDFVLFSYHFFPDCLSRCIFCILISWLKFTLEQGGGSTKK